MTYTPSIWSAVHAALEPVAAEPGGLVALQPEPDSLHALLWRNLWLEPSTRTGTSFLVAELAMTALLARLAVRAITPGRELQGLARAIGHDHDAAFALAHWDDPRVPFLAVASEELPPAEYNGLLERTVVLSQREVSMWSILWLSQGLAQRELGYVDLVVSPTYLPRDWSVFLSPAGLTQAAIPGEANKRFLQRSPGRGVWHALIGNLSEAVPAMFACGPRRMGLFSNPDPTAWYRPNA